MACNLRLITAAATALLAACAKDETAPAQTLEDQGMIEFRSCAVCHARTAPDDPETIRLSGPSLFGVAGAPAARLADYDYSPALRRAGFVWDDAKLDAYIARPQAVVPGTRMGYGGEPDAEKRAAIIAYLKTLK